MTLDPEEHPTSGPVIRDLRRIDPETGEVRERPQGGAHGLAHPPTPKEQQDVTPDSTSADELAAAEAALAERTADLQRLQAEYVNYKRRVDRDRQHARTNAVASTLGALLPVLDDIARAREHGELTGGFKAVADSFERTVSGLGLVSFGEVGDTFDPHIHEALAHSYSDDVTGPTCQAILQVGYRIDDRVVRPARVAVAEPAEAPPAGDPAEDDSDEAGDLSSYDTGGREDSGEEHDGETADGKADNEE